MEKHKPTDKVVVIKCVDPRNNKSGSNFMAKVEEFLGTDNIYVINYPGPDSLYLEDKEPQRKAVEIILQQTLAVLAEHDIINPSIYLFAHSECAGHQRDDDQHHKDVQSTATLMSEELGLNTPIKTLVGVKMTSDLDWKIFE